MDIGTITAWIQVAIWGLATILWVGRLARGEIKTHPWIKQAFSSNGLVATVVVAGLIMSGISLYFSYAVNAIPKELTVNVSAYQPPYTAPMKVISNETFEDQDVPLDGLIYDHCTFVNVCFMYDGGAYGLQNSVIKKHWKVCVKDQRISNYSTLMDSLKLFSPRATHSTKKGIVQQP